MPTIELLGSPDCPHVHTVRSNLKTALADLGLASALREVNQGSLHPEDERRGYPSPTILVNGRDLYGMSPTNASCRLFIEGIPSAAAIAKRIAGTLCA
jgi:hypothetical protein